MTNVRKSPLLRFADNTVLDLRAVVRTMPPRGETFTVFLSNGESFEIYTNREFFVETPVKCIPYDDFVNAWYRAVQPTSLINLIFNKHFSI